MDLVNCKQRGSRAPLASPNDPDNSLVQKIEGTAAVGARMPRGLPPLSTANINLIRQWVEQGALNN